MRKRRCNREIREKQTGKLRTGKWKGEDGHKEALKVTKLAGL
jgi:hypothetical protein